MPVVRGSSITLMLVISLSAPARMQDLAAPPSRIVVIDPGHGGEDIGVRGSGGLEEKQLVLDVARRLRARIEAQLPIRAVLTRDDDRSLAPDERAAIANAAGGVLFLSLHANAAPSASVAGAEVYYAGLDATQRTLPPLDPSPVLLVPWDEAQARQFDGSARLAGIVQEELQRAVPMRPRSINQVPLRALRGANMAAVLVEMLFLTNPDQEQAAGTAELKDALATALTQAVARFDPAANPPPQP